MVKLFATLLLCASALLAETPKDGTPSVFRIFNADPDVIIVEEPKLDQKIMNYVGEDFYVKNRDFLKVLFSPESDYYLQDKVDVVKVFGVLKENGVLKLSFDRVQELGLRFKTRGSMLLFVKVLGDSLRNMGFYRYATTESQFDHEEFIWNIALESEYAIDPMTLQKELQKRGCRIVDIVKTDALQWEYTIDMENVHLDVPVLVNGEKLKLKRSLYAHWLNVENISKLYIKSSFKDDWYPDISYYDSQLRMIEVFQKDKKTRNLSLVMPQNAKYIKISDIYTLKNVKDDLILKPRGSRQPKEGGQ